MKHFCYITLRNPATQDQTITLEFELYPLEIAYKWRSKVIEAKNKGYKIDDPERFYGMNGYEADSRLAVTKINDCIATINSYQNIIERPLEDINDQDTLNYLHNIFEVYHGLLDQQTNSFWVNAPPEVQTALVNLNISVHRVESVQRSNIPRFVVTYFQLPKYDKLSADDFKYMTNCFTFGGLYLNYVEIGKTLEDLMLDNDTYIHPEAFKPWNYYSADFKVILGDTSTIEAKQRLYACKNYFNDNRDFFESKGFKENDLRLKPGAISLGKLCGTNQSKMFKLIQQHQYVLDVDFN